MVLPAESIKIEQHTAFNCIYRNNPGAAGIIKH